MTVDHQKQSVGCLSAKTSERSVRKRNCSGRLDESDWEVNSSRIASSLSLTLFESSQKHCFWFDPCQNWSSTGSIVKHSDSNGWENLCALRRVLAIIVVTKFATISFLLFMFAACSSLVAQRVQVGSTEREREKNATSLPIMVQFDTYYYETSRASMRDRSIVMEYSNGAHNWRRGRAEVWWFYPFVSEWSIDLISHEYEMLVITCYLEINRIFFCSRLESNQPETMSFARCLGVLSLSLDQLWRLI